MCVVPQIYLNLFILFVIPLDLIACCFVRPLWSVCTDMWNWIVFIVMDPDCIRELSSWGMFGWWSWSLWCNSKLSQSISSGRVTRGSSGVTGFFVWGCGTTFGHSGNIQVLWWSTPPSKQSEFHSLWVCGRLFCTQGDRTRHQNTVAAEVLLAKFFRSSIAIGQAIMTLKKGHKLKFYLHKVLFLATY